MSGLSVSLRLRQGAFELDAAFDSSARTLGVFGASGSGKTSLLEALAGWRKPQPGRILLGASTLHDSVQGIDVPLEERGIGYVPQDALLWPHWSVGRNVRAGALRHADEALVARTLAILDIAALEDRSVQGLSGGERQRTALARALVSRPRLLLLDEPLGALDAPLRRRILPYLVRIRDEYALPTVLVSHDALETQALCDEVVVLERGRIVARGRPDEVLRERHDGGEPYENVLHGRVAALDEGLARVEFDSGGETLVPARALAQDVRVLVAIRSDEILVALDAPARISARNVHAVRVERVDDGADEGVRVDARLQGGAGALLSASLTRSAVRELGLRPGVQAWYVYKSQSCRVLSAG